MKKWCKIYMNGKLIMTCPTLARAEAMVRRFEREYRYEVEVEHYPMPSRGYPVYEIKH